VWIKYVLAWVELAPGTYVPEDDSDDDDAEGPPSLDVVGADEQAVLSSLVAVDKGAAAPTRAVARRDIPGDLEMLPLQAESKSDDDNDPSSGDDAVDEEHDDRFTELRRTYVENYLDDMGSSSANQPGIPLSHLFEIWRNMNLQLGCRRTSPADQGGVSFFILPVCVMEDRLVYRAQKSNRDQGREDPRGYLVPLTIWTAIMKSGRLGEGLRFHWLQVSGVYPSHTMVCSGPVLPDMLLGSGMRTPKHFTAVCLGSTGDVGQQRFPYTKGTATANKWPILVDTQQAMCIVSSTEKKGLKPQLVNYQSLAERAGVSPDVCGQWAAMFSLLLIPPWITLPMSAAQATNNYDELFSRLDPWQHAFNECTKRQLLRARTLRTYAPEALGVVVLFRSTAWTTWSDSKWRLGVVTETPTTTSGKCTVESLMSTGTNTLRLHLNDPNRCCTVVGVSVSGVPKLYACFKAPLRLVLGIRPAQLGRRHFVGGTLQSGRTEADLLDLLDESDRMADKQLCQGPSKRQYTKGWEEVMSALCRRVVRGGRHGSTRKYEVERFVCVTSWPGAHQKSESMVGVKWKTYPHLHNSLEPRSILDGCPEIAEQYWRSLWDAFQSRLDDDCHVHYVVPSTNSKGEPLPSWYPPQDPIKLIAYSQKPNTRSCFMKCMQTACKYLVNDPVMSQKFGWAVHRDSVAAVQCTYGSLVSRNFESQCLRLKVMKNNKIQRIPPGSTAPTPAIRRAVGLLAGITLSTFQRPRVRRSQGPRRRPQQQARPKRARTRTVSVTAPVRLTTEQQQIQRRKRYQERQARVSGPPATNGLPTPGASSTQSVAPVPHPVVHKPHPRNAAALADLQLTLHQQVADREAAQDLHRADLQGVLDDAEGSSPPTPPSLTLSSSPPSPSIPPAGAPPLCLNDVLEGSSPPTPPSLTLSSPPSPSTPPAGAPRLCLTADDDRSRVGVTLRRVRTPSLASVGARWASQPPPPPPSSPPPTVTLRSAPDRAEDKGGPNPSGMNRSTRKSSDTSRSQDRPTIRRRKTTRKSTRTPTQKGRRIHMNRVSRGSEDGVHILVGRTRGIKMHHAVVAITNSQDRLRHFWDPANPKLGWRPLRSPGGGISGVFPDGALIVYRVDHLHDDNCSAFASLHADIFGAGRLWEGRERRCVDMPSEVSHFAALWLGPDSADVFGTEVDVSSSQDPGGAQQ
jgi:hypothetical protein